MVKRIIFSILIVPIAILFSCNDTSMGREIEDPTPVDWSNRRVTLPTQDSLTYGKSYLSVYSQIYSYNEHTSLDLTATVSIRNTSDKDSIYLLKANYFDTTGDPLHSYTNQPILLKPMETLEIVIAEFDRSGGTGANFIFDWAKKNNTSEPIFEAVMISTYGQQGLSFTTRGERIE